MFEIFGEVSKASLNVTDENFIYNNRYQCQEMKIIPLEVIVLRIVYSIIEEFSKFFGDAFILQTL